MYIQFRNCNKIHIWNKIAYVYSDEGVYMLDEVSSQVAEYIRKNLSYEEIVSYFLEMEEADSDEAEKAVKEIIETNRKFMAISEKKNIISITGEYGIAYPSKVQISLTNRCVHKCIHCFKKCEYKGSDISYEAVHDVLEKLKGKCTNLEFTGGEPFLHKDILKLIDEYKSDFKIGITTSGYNLQQYEIEDLKKIDMIQISLHGSQKDIHDKFVQKQGSFENVVRNIKWLCDNNINVVVSRCISYFEENDMTAFIKLCADMGVKYVIVGIILNIGRAKNTHCATYEEEKEKLLKFLRNYKGKKVHLIFDDENTCVGSESKYVFHCMGGKLKWYINEDGEVYPCTYCQDKKISMGNIEKDKMLVNNILYQNYYDVYNKKLVRELFEINGGKQSSDFDSICTNIRKPEIEVE